MHNHDCPSTGLKGVDNKLSLILEELKLINEYISAREIAKQRDIKALVELFKIFFALFIFILYIGFIVFLYWWKKGGFS